ncbi:MAG TPA: hypothetical protein VMK66_09465 [Myxococcales bacterium]|nr:hypothetical protein [Myxococcales bacterium]
MRERRGGSVYGHVAVAVAVHVYDHVHVHVHVIVNDHVDVF